ncbi:12_t:CDS:2 [Paraglomus brasilianum]|uniref:12_t:CDS:1 n=1 Tax=Paraglomus brasilianum TaxID=144538 RepID=A0A9N9GP90_9GLOM|nr:12_t:CDS:2 [Paraglomus brasilianum]
MVDALPTPTDGNSSDPTSESVFDLMSTVLIASIITIDVDHIKRGEKLLQRTFYSVCALITFLIIPSMEIWFCVGAYKDTNDTFFIAYLTTILLMRALRHAIELCRMRNMSVKYVYLLPLFLYFICRFGKDIVFGFMAVKRGYVKSPTHWFVFGPLIMAFLVGVGLFIYILKSSDELNEWEQTLEAMNDKVTEEERNEKRGDSSGSEGGSGHSGDCDESNTSTRWVFWYYDPHGNRSCGNLCILTLIITLGLISFTTIGCLLYWRICSRKQGERESFQSNFDNASISNSQRTDLESDNVLLSYENKPPVPESTARKRRKHKASTDAYEAAEKFAQDYPPREKFPSDTDISYIINKGGAPAYRFDLDPQSATRQQTTVSDDGRVIQFHGEEDDIVQTVQTNYPLLVPSLAYAINTTRNESNKSNESNDVNREQDKKNVKDDAIIQIPMYTPVLTSEPITLEKSSKLLSYASSETGQKRSLDAGDNPESILHYCEITVLSNTNPKNTTIAIGLATKPYPPSGLLGWNLYSVGYHSDGYKFNDAFEGRSYGPEWGKVGDTVGCGYYPATGLVFFTKNGQTLGTAFTDIRHLWYPTIGADGPCKLEVNFGDGERQFRYNEAKGFGPTGPVRKVSSSTIFGNRQLATVSKCVSALIYLPEC